MTAHDDNQVTSISKAKSLEEISEFWDTHSVADYWDQTQEVDITVRARRRCRVTIDPDLYAQVEAQAHERGVLPETLINLLSSRQLQQTR